MHLECIARSCFCLSKLDDLTFLQDYIQQNPCRYFILGGGSNVLLPEKYAGLVIQNKLQGVALLNDGLESKSTKTLVSKNTHGEPYNNDQNETILIRAMAGVIWDDFVRQSLENGCYGLENLSLIPGTVGAAPIQNIGAYGVEVKDFIEYVECFDLNTGTTIKIANKDCNFSYRNSRFKQEPNLLVTAVVFRLRKTQKLNISYGDIADKISLINKPTALDLRKVIIETRTSKLPDPLVIPNVGSFFHNPILANHDVERLKLKYPNLPVYKVDDGYSKVSAGWLIDQHGFKGLKYKNVGVYAKQALVLVNYFAVCRDEVLELAKIIQDKIFNQDQIKLNIEPIQV